MRRGGVGGEGRQVGNVCGEGGGLNIFFRAEMSTKHRLAIAIFGALRSQVRVSPSTVGRLIGKTDGP